MAILEKEIVVPKLIEVLRDSNIEDIDLSKVAAKALHNMTQVKDELCLFECICKKRLNDDVEIQKHASTCYDMF